MSIKHCLSGFLTLFALFTVPFISLAEGDGKMKADPDHSFASHHPEDSVPVSGSIPAYPLPLDPELIGNWEFIFKDRARELAPAENLVRNQGFGAVATRRFDEFADAYKNLKEREIPIFVSSDTFLHLVHIQFDETLRNIEETHFYEDLLTMLAAMESNLKQRDVGKMLEPAKTLGLDYLRLMITCLDPEQVQQVSPAVRSELQLIGRHAGFANSPLFSYMEDYSQYVPRGHYTRSEILKRYFTTMMAAGRFTFLVKGGEPHGQFAPYLVSEETARIQTLAAMLLADTLRTAAVPDGRRCREVWERIYTVTSFYTGLADDLTPLDYLSAFSCSGADSIPRLADDRDAYLRFKTELARLSPPAIYSGTGNAGTIDWKTVSGLAAPEILDKALQKTAGFRLMGQRFIPDSYFMGRLVFPSVGGPPLSGNPFTAEMTGQGLRKVWPRGLEVMALLGSDRADKWLTELEDTGYPGYGDVRKELEREIGELNPADWHRNAYWSWLALFRILLEPCPAGYQTFQLQKSWNDKSINSCLASWSQLRHDTILYAKQSYTMLAKSAIMKPPEKVSGYIEPAPEFYQALLNLTRMTRSALDAFELLSNEGRDWFKEMESMLETIRSITVKELQNQPLSEPDWEWIRTIGSRIGTVLDRQIELSPQPEGARMPSQEIEKRTTLIADVHTDSNTKQVLEEGTGFLDMAVVCVRFPDGSLQLTVGPVLSHYEFKHPMSDRLTDEAWRQILKEGNAPDRGKWVGTYLVEPGCVAIRKQ
ncbi:DUF3160 domain-containing protein [bacterium]|nr:DUF3160 domain-containing protein [candidate division CSSED10-310 bacterium]